MIGENYLRVIGDGKTLSFFKDKSFDVAFSNSVIEHLSTFEDQELMAYNIQRISNHYFIQTPAFIFPIEPHFLFPFFHWLPKSLKILFVKYFNLGWFEKQKNIAHARELILFIRILKKREIKKLFPNSIVIREWVFGFVKSYLINK